MRHELGAYLLGALDGSDRARVAAHLEICPDCRDDLVGLAPLPGLLARVPREEPVTDATTPPASAELLLVQIAGIRRRRRRVAAGLAAAFAAVAVGIFGAQQLLQGGGGPHGVVVAAANTSSHVSGRATLLATSQGSTIEVGVSGVQRGTRCQLIVLGLDGRREIAATWQATYEGTATVTGASALTPEQIRQLVVAGDAGRPLLVFAGLPLRVHPSSAT
jgi:predicted anti-sigma-YlaC factor YlaD